ncbi:MAG: undecaprenyl-diphosphate phosphatase [Armatimonadetes bacterium]|nr:undecaprenyl-diphosphate phosphatase [Armatimonadota bacterium]
MQDLTVFKAALLGLIQGLGEFLPISSSGHLKLAEHFLGLPNTDEMFAFDVLLHAATLLALVVYFWADLKAMAGAWCRSVGQLVRRDGTVSEPQARWSWLVLLAMAPTGLLALGLHKTIEPYFADVKLVCAMLLLAGTFNWYSDRCLRRERAGRRIEEMGWKDALACGTVQGLAAVFHGMSRSGSTMAVGLWRGLGGESAPRFSFLMSVPAVACALLVQLKDLIKPQGEGPGTAAMLVGFAVAAVTGYWAVNTVFTVVRRGRFMGFAWYCWGIGGLALLVLLVRGH